MMFPKNLQDGGHHCHTNDGCLFLWNEFQIHARSGMGIWFLCRDSIDDSRLFFIVLFFQEVGLVVKNKISQDNFRNNLERIYLSNPKPTAKTFMRKILLSFFIF